MRKHLSLMLLALLWVPFAARATVTSQTTSVSFTCTGSTGPFPFTFPISDPTALTVIQAGTTLASTSYTVAPVNNAYQNGGSVTLNSACPTGAALVVKRTTPLTQQSIFTDNMPIPYKTFERGLDKLTEIDQELWKYVQGQVAGPPGPPGPSGSGNFQCNADASTFTGADVGAQINAAVASLGSTGGVVCFSDTTPLTLTTTISDGGKPVIFLLGSVNITCNVQCFNVQHNGSGIIGSGSQVSLITAPSSLSASTPPILAGSFSSGLYDLTIRDVGVINYRNSRVGMIQLLNCPRAHVSGIDYEGGSSTNYVGIGVETLGGWNETIQDVFCAYGTGGICVGEGAPITGGVAWNASNISIINVVGVYMTSVAINYATVYGSPTLVDTTSIIGSQASDSGSGAVAASQGVTTVSGAQTAGASTLNVVSGAACSANTPVWIGDNTGPTDVEFNRVTTVATNTLNLMFPMIINHANAERVLCGTVGIEAGGNIEGLDIVNPHLEGQGTAIDLQGSKDVIILSPELSSLASTPVGDGIRIGACWGVTTQNPRMMGFVNEINVTNQLGSWEDVSRGIWLWSEYYQSASSTHLGIVNNTGTDLASHGSGCIGDVASRTCTASFPPIGYNHASDPIPNNQIVRDTCISGSTCAPVTFTGGSVFASAESYTCSANDDVGTSHFVGTITNISGSQVTFGVSDTSGNPVSGDTVSYICVGESAGGGGSGGGGGGGGGSSVELQTNGADNSSQSLLDFIASTTNSTGLAITPSNPSGGQEKFEITGVYTGAGGQMINVQASPYGATGNGSTSDTTAINSAIAYCNSNGGTLYFPTGNYLMTATPTAITNRACNVQGVGRASTIMTTSAHTGIALLKMQVSGFDLATHNNYIHDISFNCNTSNTSAGGTRNNVGIWMLDSAWMDVRNVTRTNCLSGILQEDNAYFEEGNVFDSNQASNNTAGFTLQCDTSNSAGCSFEHSTYSEYCQTQSPGDSCFHLDVCNTGTSGSPTGANAFCTPDTSASTNAGMTNETIHVEGNLHASGACPWSGGSTGCTAVFLLDAGGVWGSMSGQPEVDAGTGYAFFSNLNTAQNSVTASGLFNVSNGGSLFGGTWTAGYQFFHGPGPNYLGTITTTTGAYDQLTNNAIAPGSRCFFTPTNSIASGMTSLYIDSPAANWGFVYFHHPSSLTASGNFDIWCY